MLIIKIIAFLLYRIYYHFTYLSKYIHIYRFETKAVKITLDEYLRLKHDFVYYDLSWDHLIYDDIHLCLTRLFEESVELRPMIECLLSWHQRLYPNSDCDHELIINCLDEYTDNSVDFFRITNDLMEINVDLLESISHHKHLLQKTIVLWHFICKYSPQVQDLPNEIQAMIQNCI